MIPPTNFNFGIFVDGVFDVIAPTRVVFKVPRADRRFRVLRDARDFVVGPETRSFKIPREPRSFKVARDLSRNVATQEATR